MPGPRRRIELARTAAAIKRGGASPKAATVDPAVSLRYGTVSTAPAGSPPTVGVKVDGSTTEVQLGVLRSALPLAVNDVVLLGQLGSDLVVVDVVAASSTVTEPTLWWDASIADISGVGNTSSADESALTVTPPRDGALVVLATCSAYSTGAGAYQAYGIVPTFAGATGGLFSATSDTQAVQPASGQNHVTTIGFGVQAVTAGTPVQLGVHVTTGGGGATSSTFERIRLLAILGAQGV